MRVLVIGSSGQLARALREAPCRGLEVVTTGRPNVDLERPETLEAALDTTRPDVIINAAAYTAVDRAEAEPVRAMRINAHGPLVLAGLAAQRDTPILHVSTDYVFAGDKDAPYLEVDAATPATVYGQSKLEGELRVAAANPKHVILRTAWLHAPYGTNFVRTMLRLAAAGEELRVVADQHGSPTYAPDFASGLLEIAARVAHGEVAAWGTYHMTAAGSCSWADFAEQVIMSSAERGGPVAKVKRITAAEYRSPAKRPASSRLDCSKLLSDYGVALPDWRSGVDRCVARLIGSGGAT